MKNERIVQGTLRIVGRHPNPGTNGNPRYIVTIGANEFVTSRDSQLGYSVTNYDNKWVIATVGDYYGIATVKNIKLKRENN